jgi:hypothetical protein
MSCELQISTEFTLTVERLIYINVSSRGECLSRIRETNRSSQMSDLVELVKDILS